MQRYKDIGEYLRELRIDRGLTISKVAGWLGVSPAYISLIEEGHRRPSFELMKKYASLLNQPIMKMLTLMVSDSAKQENSEDAGTCTFTSGVIVSIDFFSLQRHET